MMQKKQLAVTLAALTLGAGAVQAQEMSFFVTSSNPGNGGNLGGLAGADAYCQSLAEDAGAGDKTWHAYLSTSTTDARDRIGNGPWYNVNGAKIADNVANLHSEGNNLTAATALTEEGDAPNYLAGNPPTPVAQPLEHDILTGTNDDGTANDMTCNNWTDGSDASQAMLGHADRMGREPGLNSWNAIHPSQGCGMAQLAPTGGAGLFYCFAID